jgi:carbon monoxide dehydrogenase subunit G
MKLEGDYVFEASVPEVWSALFDPVILAAVMPGCEKLELVDNQYVGEIKVKVGPIQGKFTGKVDLKDKDEPHSYTMIVDGRGAPGFIKATALVKLAAEGAGTRVTYDADAQIGGKIASVGQRLIEASARAIVAQSLEGLHTNIKLRAAAYREAAAKEAAEVAAAGVAAAPIAPVIAAPGPAVAAIADEPAAAPAPPVVAPARPATIDLSTGVASLSQSIPIIPPKPELASVPPTAEPLPASGTELATDAESAVLASSAPSTVPAKPAAATAPPGAATKLAPAKPVDFVPVKTSQAQLANAVAKEVASSLFPRSVLVAIILIEALVIVWLLLRH